MNEKTTTRTIRVPHDSAQPAHPRDDRKRRHTGRGSRAIRVRRVVLITLLLGAASTVSTPPLLRGTPLDSLGVSELEARPEHCPANLKSLDRVAVSHWLLLRGLLYNS